MKKKDLKATVEEGIKAILESKDEPSEGRMKALALGIKMCALNAKLEESDYGDFFSEKDDERELGITSGIQKGPKPERGRRANGSGDAAADLLPEA